MNKEKRISVKSLHIRKCVMTWYYIFGENETLLNFKKHKTNALHVIQTICAIWANIQAIGIVWQAVFYCSEIGI